MVSRLLALGHLPEVHCWAVVPELNLIMDPTTGYLPVREVIEHYYKLLEAFDPGGSHRADAACASLITGKIDEACMQKIRELRGSHVGR